MIHPHTILRHVDDGIGYGVFAVRPIPLGTVTWVRDGLDREFTPGEVAAFDARHREVLDHFSYRDARGHYVFCWDHARFMNHSGRPACLLTPYGVEMAVRDIPAGGELTIDYGCLNIIEPFRPRRERGGRPVVRPGDLCRHGEAWDGLVALAVARFGQVLQPLAEWIPASTAACLRAVATGARAPTPMREMWCGEGEEPADGLTIDEY